MLVQYPILTCSRSQGKVAEFAPLTTVRKFDSLFGIRVVLVKSKVEQFYQQQKKLPRKNNL